MTEMHFCNFDQHRMMQSQFPLLLPFRKQLLKPKSGLNLCAYHLFTRLLSVYFECTAKSQGHCENVIMNSLKLFKIQCT